MMIAIFHLYMMMNNCSHFILKIKKLQKIVNQLMIWNKSLKTIAKKEF